MNCFSDEDDESCVVKRTSFIESLQAQIKALKMAEAILLRFMGPDKTLSRNAYLNRIREGDIQPEEIAEFNIAGVEFSEQDKLDALETCIRTYTEIVSHELNWGVYQPNPNSCSKFVTNRDRPLNYIMRNAFGKVISSYITANPLLAFLPKSRNLEPKDFIEAIEELIEYNESFASKVGDMEVEHSEEVAKYFTLWIDDHEMGLMNFPNIALRVVKKMPRKKQAKACKAWSELKSLQKKRIYGSVGTGLGVSVACGGSLWGASALLTSSMLPPAQLAGLLIAAGTLASGSCTAAFADGVYGSWVGVRDAFTAHYSGYAGSMVALDGTATSAIRSVEEAKVLRTRGILVGGANFLTLGMIGKAVSAEIKLARTVIRATEKSASKSMRAKLVKLAQLPATDSSVSIFESQAALLALSMTLVRGPEIFIPRANPRYRQISSYQEACGFSGFD